MQISLPDDPRYQATAAAAGYSNLEDYVRAMLNAEVSTMSPSKTDTLSDDQWEQSLRKIQDICKSANPNFDDRRESLYPVRD